MYIIFVCNINNMTPIKVKTIQLNVLPADRRANTQWGELYNPGIGVHSEGTVGLRVPPVSSEVVWILQVEMTVWQ